jgi:hypothetical protein
MSAHIRNQIATLQRAAIPAPVILIAGTEDPDTLRRSYLTEHPAFSAREIVVISTGVPRANTDVDALALP